MTDTRLIPSTLLACTLTVLATQAQAQSSLGRLFHTPAERQSLDAGRAKPGSSVTAGNGAGAGNPAAIAPDIMAGAMPPGQSGYQAANQPVGPQTDSSAGPVAGAPGKQPATPGMATPQPSMASSQADAAPPPSEQLQLNGVLHTSSGRSTAWLNNVPQNGAANKFSNRNSKALTVTLPSGRRVVLQPGQRYDLAEGRVKDITEP